MASQRPDEHRSDPYALHPDDVSALDFPVAMRGFERDAVKRKLRKVADSYATTLRQRDRATVMAEEANERTVAAEAEIHASAHTITELTKRSSTLERELADAQTRIAQLDRALARAASEREQAHAGADQRELEFANDRIGELELALEHARAERAEAAAVAPVVAPEATAREQPEEAGELLVSAVRAAESLRAAVRDEAQRTLKKAREHAAKLGRQADLERRALEDARARAKTLASDAERVGQELERARAERLQAGQDAELLRDRVLAEAEHTLASVQEQRQRLQSLLGDALVALEVGTGDARGVLDDLASRLQPQATDPA